MVPHRLRQFFARLQQQRVYKGRRRLGSIDTLTFDPPRPTSLGFPGAASGRLGTRPLVKILSPHSFFLQLAKRYRQLSLRTTTIKCKLMCEIVKPNPTPSVKGGVFRN